MVARRRYRPSASPSECGDTDTLGPTLGTYWGMHGQLLRRHERPFQLFLESQKPPVVLRTPYAVRMQAGGFVAS